MSYKDPAAVDTTGISKMAVVYQYVINTLDEDKNPVSDTMKIVLESLETWRSAGLDYNSLMDSIKTIKTKQEFVHLCMKTNMPQSILDTFDGMDLVVYMNEFERIVNTVTLTNVKTYSYKFDAPRLYHYGIGYFVDIHNVVLKINNNWLKAEQNEDWWKERIEKIMLSVAEWVKRILYMNEYDKHQDHLASMRVELDKKGVQYIDSEEYQTECRRKLKYQG